MILKYNSYQSYDSLPDTEGAGAGTGPAIDLNGSEVQFLALSLLSLSAIISV